MRELSIVRTELGVPIVPAEMLNVNRVKEVINVGSERYLRIMLDGDVDDPASDPLVVAQIKDESVVLWRDRVWRVLDPSVMEFLEILATPIAA